MSLLFLRRAKPLFLSRYLSTFSSPSPTNLLRRSFHGSATMVRRIIIIAWFSNCLWVLRIQFVFFFFFNLQSEAEKKILTEEELERKKKKDDKVWLFSPILIEIFSQLRYWIVMQCSHSDNYGFDHSKKSEFDEKIDR